MEFSPTTRDSVHENGALPEHPVVKEEGHAVKNAGKVAENHGIIPMGGRALESPRKFRQFSVSTGCSSR